MIRNKKSLFMKGLIGILILEIIISIILFRLPFLTEVILFINPLVGFLVMLLNLFLPDCGPNGCSTLYDIFFVIMVFLAYAPIGFTIGYLISKYAKRGGNK